jgi:hypothetical protein
MPTRLSPDVQREVDERHGFAEVAGDGGVYVVLSMQRYRELMGVGEESEFGVSLAAIEEGLADVEAGRTRSLDEFFREFDERHGIPS